MNIYTRTVIDAKAHYDQLAPEKQPAPLYKKFQIKK
jgi:hypothetical protein